MLIKCLLLEQKTTPWAIPLPTSFVALKRFKVSNELIWQIQDTVL